VVKHVIHAPGIGADAGDGQPARGGFFQSRLQLVEQAIQVPVQRAGGLDRAVGKTMQLLQDDFAAVERAEHEASAIRTEVAGEVMCGHSENRCAFYAAPTRCQRDWEGPVSPGARFVPNRSTPKAPW